MSYPAITFRLKPRRNCSPVAYEARCRQVVIGHVQAIGTGWFWYGGGENTAHRPVTELKEAQQQLREYFQKKGLL